MNLRLLALLASALAMSASPFGNAAARDSSVPVVVELFTSEGCSSCPPADRLLGELVATQPVKGALVVALSEHVDYWNQLGWKDPFSASQFSKRQADYARRRSTDVYTPQMVIDGQEAFVGSDRGAAIAAIRRAAATPKLPLTLSWSLTGPRRWMLTVQLVGNETTADASVMLAVVEDDLKVDVRAGENGGHTLQHSAVTRRLVELGQADRAGMFMQKEIRLDLDPAWRRASVRLVAFAAGHGSGRILAATMTGL